MDDELTVLAIKAAKGFVKRTSANSWRDYLGAAWAGINRALKKGYTDRKLLVISAYCTCIDQYRSETSHRKAKRNNFSLVLFSDLDGVPDREMPRDERRTLEDLWEEERHKRVRLDAFTRLVGYLYFVEGMPQRQIARYFKISEVRVSQIVRGFMDSVGKRVELRSQRSYKKGSV